MKKINKNSLKVSRFNFIGDEEYFFDVNVSETAAEKDLAELIKKERSNTERNSSAYSSFNAFSKWLSSEPMMNFYNKPETRFTNDNYFRTVYVPQKTNLESPFTSFDFDPESRNNDIIIQSNAAVDNVKEQTNGAIVSINDDSEMPTLPFLKSHTETNKIPEMNDKKLDLGNPESATAAKNDEEIIELDDHNETTNNNDDRSSDGYNHIDYNRFGSNSCSNNESMARELKRRQRLLKLAKKLKSEEEAAPSSSLPSVINEHNKTPVKIITTSDVVMMGHSPFIPGTDTPIIISKEDNNNSDISHVSSISDTSATTFEQNEPHKKVMDMIIKGNDPKTPARKFYPYDDSLDVDGCVNKKEIVKELIVRKSPFKNISETSTFLQTPDSVFDCTKSTPRINKSFDTPTPTYDTSPAQSAACAEQAPFANYFITSNVDADIVTKFRTAFLQIGFVCVKAAEQFETRRMEADQDLLRAIISLCKIAGTNPVGSIPTVLYSIAVCFNVIDNIYSRNLNKNLVGEIYVNTGVNFIQVFIEATSELIMKINTYKRCREQEFLKMAVCNMRNNEITQKYEEPIPVANI